MHAATSTIDADEVERFSRLSANWWDEHGPFAPLHAINPLRIHYIQDMVNTYLNVQNLKELRILDIGCGGGLVCEPLARLGAHVTGIDASEKNIAISTAHATQSGLGIEYRAIPAETLHAEGAQFDVVLALEIIEHVADTQAFMAACMGLIRPGGILIVTTLNRTTWSFGMAIVGAEYILRWLPRGTHDWHKFLRPSELARLVEHAGGHVQEMCGMAYNPLSRNWSLKKKDLRVNYLLTAQKPA